MADEKRGARKESGGFTDEEGAAVKERAKELEHAGTSDGESDVLARIAEPVKKAAR